MSKTDIIIVTYQKAELTKRCFESVAANTKDYRVLWIDNGSDEEHVRQIQTVCDAKLEDWLLFRFDKNLGFARAVNKGLRQFLFDEQANYIVLLNNDVIVTKNWLNYLIEALESVKFDVIGPVTSEGNFQTLDEIRPQIRSVEIPHFENEDHEERAKMLHDLFGLRIFPVTSLLNFFCVLLTRKAVEETGLFDEQIFAYGEDNDYCERLKRTGKKLGLSIGTYVHHEHGATAKLFGDGWIDEQRRKAVEYIRQKYMTLR